MVRDAYQRSRLRKRRVARTATAAQHHCHWAHGWPCLDAYQRLAPKLPVNRFFICASLHPARMLGHMAMLLDAPPPFAALEPRAPGRGLQKSLPDEEDDFLRGEEGRRRVPFLPTAAAPIYLHASIFLHIKTVSTS